MRDSWLFETWSGPKSSSVDPVDAVLATCLIPCKCGDFFIDVIKVSGKAEKKAKKVRFLDTYSGAWL